ncbi:hypothetical protein [Halarchaeum acidiphilum]|uniref:hypothetical protein n=1 Tax=Halarchaeum acidiphilum TaxID=489138 RepID=UPI001F23DD00|nr:hypothetical protein [Halarchaeum acidiphilum]
MTETDATYQVEDVTGNPDHPSFEDIWQLMLERGEHPRADHINAHLDELMADVLERCGEETVRTATHRILVESYPFRTATVNLGVQNVDGVRIGTTAVATLRELHQPTDAYGDADGLVVQSSLILSGQSAPRACIALGGSVLLQNRPAKPRSMPRAIHSSSSSGVAANASYSSSFSATSRLMRYWASRFILHLVERSES